ncbi:MAG: TetR/AcrR family transcriptional regulator [Lachnospiraceae bacterium]|nr:TetR/AcrR family transcriptional regulator [Lachnospiraceae bacterium]
MNEKFFDLKSEKQDKMINAALHLFADNGYKHASTDDIVREAGISKGLLFHYFINKEGLYSFLTDYSVKYLLFEFDRSIGEETEFFAFWDKLENAKAGVLRNYPYMYKFIDRCYKESDPDIKAMSGDALKRYETAINAYQNKLSSPSVRNGISISQLQSLIKYTVDGLTSEQLSSGKPNPEQLYANISEYIRLLKNLTVV